MTTRDLRPARYLRSLTRREHRVLQEVANGATAPEIARAKVTVRKRIGGLMKQWVEFMPGATPAERERNFFVIFSAMAGAVSVARILTEPADRQKVLVSMRDHLFHSF